jgi:2-polyprenyl-3-methyl-5-hydroxy-6-metoxy-1,4-benzoquinol methylase
MMTAETAPSISTGPDALADRLFQATVGAFDLLAIYLGDRLGLYRAMTDGAWLTPGALAARAGIDARYAREWLEHQAVGAIVDCEDTSAPADERRYRLPAGHAEVLVDDEHPALMAPMARFVVGSAAAMPLLLDAYRSGVGVPWDAYGPDGVEAQAALNRPAFVHDLAGTWVAAMPDVVARLGRPGARIADIACGAGWSTIALARGFSNARVDGFDLDRASIELAGRNLASDGADVADRVTFVHDDAAAVAGDGGYDLVTIVEAVHDLSQPVDVLRSVRGLLAPGGAVLVVDERVAETFTAPGDEVERLMYGYSLAMCLPNGLAESPSVGTGTVLRPSVLREMAEEAGFSAVTVLPVDHDTFRLYRLDA